MESTAVHGLSAGYDAIVRAAGFDAARRLLFDRLRSLRPTASYRRRGFDMATYVAARVGRRVMQRNLPQPQINKRM